MILYPAIDISEGKAVRLVKGDFNQVTVYEDSPLEAARAWVDAGARFLHVVDLDGARTGTPKSLEHLEQIAHELHVPVQYGGGLRSLPAVRDALASGRSLCTQDGVFERLPEIIKRRDAASREFFAKPTERADQASFPAELPAYLA